MEDSDGRGPSSLRAEGVLGSSRAASPHADGPRPAPTHTASLRLHGLRPGADGRLRLPGGAFGLPRCNDGRDTLPAAVSVDPSAGAIGAGDAFLARHRSNEPFWGRGDLLG